MVKRYIVDDCELWLDHVGGIKTPSHTYFQDSPIHPLFRKKAECHGCGHLKKGGRLAFIHYSPHCLEDIQNLLVPNILLVQAKALIESDQMRRGI